MRRTERIIFAFAAFGEARQPAACPQRTDTVTPPGQYLMRIALMANVPDKLVIGRVEDIMNRSRQFDDAEPRAKMAACNRYGRNHFAAQFISKLTQLIRFQGAEIGGCVDRIEQRCIGCIGHALTLKR